MLGIRRPSAKYVNERVEQAGNSDCRSERQCLHGKPAVDMRQRKKGERPEEAPAFEVDEFASYQVSDYGRSVKILV